MSFMNIFFLKMYFRKSIPYLEHSRSFHQRHDTQQQQKKNGNMEISINLRAL